MTTAQRLLFFLPILFMGGCAIDDRAPLVAYDNVREYRLGAGDQIRVVVYDQPALSSVYSVGASGSVSIPLAGSFKAENRTVQQVESLIRSALKEKDLVADPRVSVEVAIYRPFSILGEVRNPGRFPYSPGMTIEDAVAVAGGYTVHANQDAIRVTRRTNEGQATDHRPPTATFFPGDTLYVTERWY
jgi:polysaccharide biosynthesis/export protein